jgi:hypothetical protein
MVSFSFFGGIDEVRKHVARGVQKRDFGEREIA